jgi:hypothetical protein
MVLSGAFPRLAFADEPGLGSVTVIQNTPIRGDQDFHYSSEVPEMSTSFSLDDDNDPYLPSEQSSGSYVPPGQYQILQDEVPGWELTSVQCQDPNGGENGYTNGVLVDVSAGEDIVCTFTNTPTTGDINIFQTTQPQDPNVFQYSGDFGSFGLADDGDESGADLTWRNFSTTGIGAGTYTVGQAFANGWNLIGISCDDPDGGTTFDLANRTVTFDLDGGETINCTFVDQPTAPTKGSVQFTVDSVPDNAVDVSFSGGPRVVRARRRRRSRQRADLLEGAGERHRRRLHGDRHRPVGLPHLESGLQRPRQRDDDEQHDRDDLARS